jgi:carboxylesterase type B
LYDEFDMHEETVEVRIAQGQLRGSAEGGIWSFKGIPYAAPLVGLNRWRPPRPRGSFPGAFDATNFGDICPQYQGTVPSWLLPKAGKALMQMMKNVETHRQGPDALNLNVWTASLNEGERLPVMVLIHGGGRSLGSGADPILNGRRLARQRVVVITLNYRLGMMGFLTGDGLFEDDVLVGNRGFMDILAALEWVRDNVAQFGGDPGNVTIVGQSGGGTAVWALLASPTSEGLFHRAICMSGPINMVSIDDQLKLTRDVLTKLKVPVGDAQALANLGDQQTKSAIAQTLLFTKRGGPYGDMSRTKLPATGAYGTKFLPNDVLQALEIGRAKNVDIMIGSCKHDGRIAYVALPLPATLGIRLMNYMVAGMIAPDREGRSKVRKKYRAIMSGASTALIEEQIQTDALYRIRGLKAAAIHARHKRGRTFVYQFNWESPVADGALGALHGMDISFALDNLELSRAITGEVAPAQFLATAMSGAFVAFARTGQPEAPGLPAWPGYDEELRQTMLFDQRIEAAQDPGGAMRRVWDSRG